MTVTQKFLVLLVILLAIATFFNLLDHLWGIA